MHSQSMKSLRIQVPVVVAALSIALAGATAFIAVSVASATLRHGAQTQLAAIVEERAASLQDYAARLTADAHVMVEDTGFQRALRTFDNLVGEKPEPGSALALAREQYDPRFRTIVAEKHFSDLLLIDERGTVGYSVSHRREGDSITAGTLSAPLAAATRAALAAKGPGIVAFADFADTGPTARAYVVEALPDVNGGWLGVLAIEIDLPTLSQTFNASVGATGTMSLTGADGRMRSVPRTPDTREIATNEAILASRPVGLFDQTWQLAGRQALTEIDAPVREVQHAILFAALLMIVLSTGIMLVFIRHRLARPIANLTNAMSRLAEGDLSVDIPGVAKRDEMGVMARSVVVFRDGARQYRRLQDNAEADRMRSETERQAAEEAAIAGERHRVIGSIGAGLAQIAAGNLTNRMTGVFPDAYRDLQKNFNDAVEQLEHAVANVALVAGKIGAETRQLQGSAHTMASHMEQNAANLAEAALALGSISSAIHIVANNAEEASQIVATTRDEAKASGLIVAEAMAAMRRIEQSSAEIAKIIGVVDEIAFQTNLLALNAGVEAARAGDAGRGFAVVAAEVRALAQRSAEASRQVKSLITGADESVNEGVRLVEKTRTSLDLILSQVDHANVTVDRIAASAQDQAQALQQINSSVNQMNEATQRTTDMVEKTTAFIVELAAETEELSERTARFVCASAAEEPAGVTRGRPSRARVA